MISIDDHPPSDPSSSHHHQQQVSHDLKSSDIDLKFTDADLDDTNNHLPKFSIRDYVFGSRSKDIVSNWPFSTTSLQVCLKHGVKNLLPPFQSLDSLRNKSSLTRCSLENRLTDEELINSFDGKPTNEFKSMEKLDLESVTTNSSGSKGQRSKVQKLPSSQKPVNASVHIRKSRFVMKLNSGIERVEEIVPTSFILSETMASKVCPVCKIFSSSSNTTLNAHIDQCLTGEGTMKWTDSSKVIVKHKVKPRKMRLMVDVYKTAPHCTIEELDRRNGTSWATNSSFPAQEFQFQGEEDKEDPKTFQGEEEYKEDPKTTIVNSEVADNEGEVYIDTNGTKVRILSVPKAGSSDNHKAQKLVEGVKGCKLIISKKKNNSIYKQKHPQKVLKLNPNSKKLCSPKPQTRSGHEEDVVMVENCSKDDYGKESMKVANLGIIRPPWACSKRTGLLKKFSGKNQKMELQRHERKDLFVESDKSSSKCDLGIPGNLFNKAASSQNKKKMRTSLSLIKQPLKSNKMDFRKEGKHVHDEDDDEKDDDDEDDGGGDDCRSPYACPSQHSDSLDTRSKGKKFSSLTDNRSFPASKFYLKRKFSAVEKSWDKSVDESSQDSFKEQFRMEEQSVSKKNEDLRSVTSKSSNGDSSVGIVAVNVDELCDVESVGNEALSSIPAPSFMGLSNSFNPEFSKQECIDQLYQDQICSTNHAPNDVEKHENYFQMVDPIPIPGPPGSFLPASPGGDSVSEEQIQETRIPSSENQHHHDTTENQDSMSNSPVSTVSNSRSTSVQDDAYKKSSFGMGFAENGSSHNSFKNDQPCCCSRKEVALNYQESFNVKKQPIESNRSFPSSFDFKSEMFPVSNYPTSPPPETASFPTNKRFPVSSDCDAAVSPSKPVLRLMGKNLTVIKTDDDEFRPPQSSQPPPHLPVVFSQFQNGIDSQHYHVHPWSYTRSNVDLRPNYGGFMTSMDRYGHDSFYLGPSGPQARSQHGHNVLNFQAVSGRNGYSDFPRNEGDDSMRNEFLKRSQGQTNQLYTMYPPYLGGGGFQTSLGNGDFRKLNIGSLSSSSSSPSTSHLQPSRAYYHRGYP